MTVAFTVDATDVIKGLERINFHMAPRRILKTLAQRYVREIALGFRDEKQPGPSGSAWKPLAPSTIRRRRSGRGRGNPKILQDTGALRRSFVTGQPIRLTSFFVEVGTNISYAPIHHFGFEQVPSRPLLPNKGDIELVTRQELNAIIRKAVADFNAAGGITRFPQFDFRIPISFGR